ncbi:tripeptidyl peptidase SED3 [Cordyceps militaris]|uniref:tripeptidyl-peptidase II n=1 Tax=Cordyceps militaris TaxID=73501 RepID=A0A2H4SQ69_CORMI|nr:tripeptidyl peptidase SED3 [Cordyceps militaris]
MNSTFINLWSYISLVYYYHKGPPAWKGNAPWPIFIGLLGLRKAILAKDHTTGSPPRFLAFQIASHRAGRRRHLVSEPGSRHAPQILGFNFRNQQGGYNYNGRSARVSGFTLSVASASSVVLEQVPVLPADWTQLDNAVDAARGISFSIALKQPKMDVPALMAERGRRLSLDEVHALRTPDESAVDGVLKWLRDENISHVTREQDVLRVQTTVAEAEKLLHSKFNHYAYGGKVAKLRTREYSIPEDLVDAISFVYPVSNFMRPSPSDAHVASKLVKHAAANRTQATAKVPCSDAVGISCLKQLYNITYKSPDRKSPVRFGISGYLEQNANHDDVKKFLMEQTNITNYDFTVEKVNGGEDPSTPAGVEAVLDLEYGMGIGYPAAVTFYATGGRGAMIGPEGQLLPSNKSDNEPYLDFVNHLLDKPDDQIPHVLSVSYGEDELSVPEQYAKRVCDAYGLLTKRGTTIIHASGDGGSTGGHYGNCRTYDGKNTNTTMPTFPASCPWVTTVGGTTHGTDPQKGAIFSSGGFSYYFGRPSWQAGAAAAYIQGLNGRLDGYYNKNGRGIPDVSVVADEYSIIVNGTSKRVWGTSASAPTFAAMIALVNDARLRNGKQSIGFLNEILYSKEGVVALTDVTEGKSYRCKFATAGWTAARGWDALTGLGEPRDFSKLMRLLRDA